MDIQSFELELTKTGKLCETVAFGTGKVYHLRADWFIENHGNVDSPQAAYVMLKAARVVSA